MPRKVRPAKEDFLGFLIWIDYESLLYSWLRISSVGENVAIAKHGETPRAGHEKKCFCVTRVRVYKSS